MTMRQADLKEIESDYFQPTEMSNESEVFLPSPLKKQQRYYHAPYLSSCLYIVFEQSSVYSCFLFLIFTLAFYIGILTTYSEYRGRCEPVLYYTELVLVIYCSIEFCLRIYASESKVRYHGFPGKRRFLIERYLIIDFLLLIAYTSLFSLNFFSPFDFSAVYFLHSLRFLQLLRFIPFDRHVKSIPLISCIIWQYRRVIFAVGYLGFLLLLPTAYLLWIVERSIQTDGKWFFRTYTDSLWFTINSMATIGYGDTWPMTLIGRALTATLCCLGVVLWTLPAGIISAGLTSIDEKRRESERLRRPAARLILAWWRLQSSNHQFRLQTNFGRYLEKERCKQFIARLLYARIRREFQRCRYGINESGFDMQIRKDIDRILHCLHSIEERLNHLNDK